MHKFTIVWRLRGQNLPDVHSWKESFKKEHANSDLSPLEKLTGAALLDEPWTPENGCLTAANKLQRRMVVATHAKEFEEVKKKGIF